MVRRFYIKNRRRRISSRGQRSVQGFDDQQRSGHVPPLIYVEITGAGNSSGERHDYKYALTAKAGETVTLKSGAYELGQTDRGSVTTEWNCGRIPEENIAVQSLAGGARSVLTLTNLEAGEYMLVCTATKHVGAGYTVRATVKLTVESDEEDTRTVLVRDTTYTTKVSRLYNGTNICNELHEVTYLDGETEVVLTNQEERANCTITAFYDSPDVGENKTVSVTVTLSDELAKQYKFANGTTTDTFTIAGTINKAFPDVKLNLLKTEFMTGEKLCDTLTISGVMEEAAVTYRYAVFPGAVSEDYDEFNTPITEETVINEAGSYGSTPRRRKPRITSRSSHRQSRSRFSAPSRLIQTAARWLRRIAPKPWAMAWK